MMKTKQSRANAIRNQNEFLSNKIDADIRIRELKDISKLRSKGLQ